MFHNIRLIQQQNTRLPYSFVLIPGKVTATDMFEQLLCDATFYNP